jgi:hypothetical protein
MAIDNLITELETKYGVKIKRVYDPDAYASGIRTMYGVYKDGYGVHTSISHVCEEYGEAKPQLVYTISILEMKLRELRRKSININRAQYCPEAIK